MDLAAFEEHHRFELDHWWFRGRRQIVSAVLDTIHPGHVFEIGCGTGGNVAEFSKRFVCSGADISGHAVRIANRSFPTNEFHHFQKLEEISHLVKRADSLLLLDVLEHIQDDYEFLGQLLSEMEVGSHLILTVPADPSLWSSHDEALFHFRRYAPDRLARSWDRQPIRVKLFSSLNHRLGGMIRLARRAKTWMTRTEQNQSDLSMPPKFLNHLLFKIFASESSYHARQFNRKIVPPKRQELGISWLVVLERIAGDAKIQKKPEFEIDQHQPATFEYGSVNSANESAKGSAA